MMAEKKSDQYEPYKVISTETPAPGLQPVYIKGSCPSFTPMPRPAKTTQRGAGAAVKGKSFCGTY